MKKSARIGDLRIRSKLIAGFAVVLAVLLAAGLLGLARLEEQMRTLIGESSRSTARSVLQQLERQIYARLETMRELALTTPEIESALSQANERMAAVGSAEEIRSRIEEQDRAWSEWLRNGEGASARQKPAFMADVEDHPVSELLRRKLDFFRRESGYRVFSEIFITDRYGGNVAQTGMTSDFRQDDEAWWTGAWNDGIRMGDIDFDDSSGVYSMELALTVEDGEGVQLGVLKAVLDIEEVHQVLSAFERQLAEDGGSLEVVDRRGVTLYPEFERRDSRPAPAGDAVWFAKTPEGTERLFVAARSAGHGRYPDIDWELTLSFPRHTVFAPILAQRRQLLILGAAVIVLALVATAMISHSLTRPIEQAAEISESMARGDLRIKIVSHGSGEVRQLLEALASMVYEVRRTVEILVTVTHRISSLAAGLSETGSHIAAGARNQTRARDDGYAAVASMKQSVKEVASISDNMRSEVFDTSAAVEEMAASTETVARNTLQLSQGVSQTLGAVRHLAESIEQVSLRVRESEESSHSALSEARSGGDAVRRTVEEVAGIKSSIDEVVAVVERLRTSGQRIDQATDIIEGIAKQSHLLGLNAAIEAANAGEHGAGFAIVADEVQRLARQSAGSTREIAALVKVVQDQTAAATRIILPLAANATRGLDLAHQAGERLEGIVESAARVNDGLSKIRQSAGDQAGVADELVATFGQMEQRTLEVEQATREQAAGSEQIRKSLELLTGVAQQVGVVVGLHRRDGAQVDEAMVHISRITSENAETADRIVAATASLEVAAEELRSLAAFFTLDEDGG